MLTGAIVAIIVVAIIYGYTAFRPVPSIGSNFGPKKSTFMVDGLPDKAFGVLSAPPPAGAKYKLAGSDATMRRVLLQDGMSMQSYGYYYPVDFLEVNGSTLVSVGIKSKYPLQLGPFVARAQDQALAAMARVLQARLTSGA